MADKEAERIKYEIEVLRATLLVMIATAGGSLSLLLGDHTFLRLGLAGMGIIATTLLWIFIWRQDRAIRKLIAQIKEPSNERY